MAQPETVRLEWDDFYSRLRWKQGEHVTLVGPTGTGKTTLANAILPKRKWQIVFAAKPRDPALSVLQKRGYVVAHEWPPPAWETRIVLWPRNERTNDIARQREVFQDALNGIYRMGGYAVSIDELFYISTFLGLKANLEILWQQGRSLGVSLVGATQRPAFVPLLAYDQATHLFFWRDNDETNLKRIAGIGSANPRVVRREVVNLGAHETLYVNTRTGAMVTTKVRK